MTSSWRSAALALTASVTALGIVSTGGSVAVADSSTTSSSRAAVPASTPAKLIKYGTSGGAATIPLLREQISKYKVNTVFVYWPARHSQRWGKYERAIPSRFDVFLSVEEHASRSAIDAMFQSFPAERGGKVYVMYHQEPEDQMSAATYRGRAEAVFAGIDRARAAGKRYLVKSVNLQPAFGVKKIDKTHPAPLGHLREWTPRGTEHLSWSVYAQAKIDSAGHLVWRNDPKVLPKRLGDAAKASIAPDGSRGLPWSASAWGMALFTSERNDSVSMRNLRTWFSESAAALKKNGARHANWFNKADYVNKNGQRVTYDIERLELKPRWNALLAAARQR